MDADRQHHSPGGQSPAASPTLSGANHKNRRLWWLLAAIVVVAAILLYAVLGKLADVAARLLERRLLRWNTAYAGH